MAKDNLTCVLYGINDIRMENRPIPVPKANQVLLQMEVVGICGSDVHYLTEGRCGPFILNSPMAIGHEASGTVVECGKDVKHLKPGDRVAIEPGIPCRLCHLCKTGSYHLCPELTFCATPPIDGNLARYYVHDADFCFKLPCNMDLEEGALMEPLSVGVHAVKRAGVKMGDVCVIFGAGPIGLVTMMAARAFGASKILVTDVLDVKLEKAKELGADYTLKTTRDMTEEEIAKKILDLLKEEPHCSFDCCGVELCVRVALKITRLAGVVLLVGMGPIEMKLPLGAALIREVDVKGIFRYCNDYPVSIGLVSSGRINVKPLITHHFTIEETKEAFETAKTGKGNPVKILIHANKNWKPSK